MKKIVIDLERVLAEKGVSKRYLCYECRLQRTQLNNYCNNDITRLDVDILARLCAGLECEIGDLLEFIPADKNDG